MGRKIFEEIKVAYKGFVYRHSLGGTKAVRG